MTRTLSLALPVLLAATAAQAATVVYSNDFSNGSVGEQPAGIYAYNASASGTSALLKADSSSPLSGNALNYYGSSYNTFMIGSFATTTLSSVGNYIEFSLDLRYLATLTNLNTGPMLGLLNSGGTALTSNTLGSRGVTSDDVGYKVSKMVNTSSASPATASDFLLLSQPTQANGGEFTTYANRLNTASSGIALNNTTPHSMTLRLTYQAGGDLLITGSLDTFQTSYTLLAANVLTYSFNEFVIAGSGGINGGNVDMDNLLITTNVPEPSTLVLSGLTLAGAALIKGRSRRKVSV